MAVKKVYRALLLSLIAAALAIQPILSVGSWRFERVRAQTTNYSSPEDAFVNNNPIDSLDELAPLLQKAPLLRLAPQDINAIRDNRVDTRVINYLAYLVKPVEQGGAGLDYIKTQRILKNYDTNGTGRIDRETLAAIEEDNGIVSAHNTGQAVDISEVGAVTCKLIKKRHFGGSSTSFQRPRPIKVAWQTRDGVNRHPTPTGASFFEIAGSMSAESILLMLNESGEMDDFSDYVKGLSLGEILQYVGANILLKSYGVGDILVNPRSEDIPVILGALLLQQSIPTLPTGTPLAENEQDIREAIARAELEEKLDLAPGSLRGVGWKNLLSSSGKRSLENSLGLPALTFENKKIGEVLEDKNVQAALVEFADKDDAFGVMPGTIDLIQAEDTLGFIYAGVNIISDALRLSPSQRGSLIGSVRNNTEPNIDMDTVGNDRNVPTNTLEALFDNKNTKVVLKGYGQRYLSKALTNIVPNEHRGLTKDIIDQLSSSATDVAYGELRRTIGLRKIASDNSIKPDEVEKKDNSRYYPVIADNLNNQFLISGNNKINNADIDGMLNKNGKEVLSKVGGNQSDKAVGWNSGTGYEIIKKEKSIGEGFEEVFSNTLGGIIGLRDGTTVSLDGDINRNYGDAIIEERLGISVNGDGTALNIGEDKLYIAFGINDFRSLTDLRKDSVYWESSTVKNSLEYTDIRLGAPIGTSKDYLLGNTDNKKLSITVASSNLSNVSEQKLIDYLEIDNEFGLSNDDSRFLIDKISNLDSINNSDTQKFLAIGKKLIGRSLDQKMSFQKDTMLNIAQKESSGGSPVDIIIDQGVKQFAGAMGSVNGLSSSDIASISRYLIDEYNGKDTTFLESRQTALISNATGIPLSHKKDIDSFTNGETRTAMKSWSAAMMVSHTSKYLPAEEALTYQEMRYAIDYDNQTAINSRANQIIDASGNTNPSTEDVQKARDYARKELMQEARDNASYKISDSFLIQAEIPIPPNFSKVMFSGTTQERSEMLTTSIFTYLDREIQRVRPSYVPGTLLKIFNGEIEPLETDELIRNITSNQSISLGSFTSGFVSNFYLFVSSPDKTNFYTDQRYDSMWQYMENWFGNTLGIEGLEPGFAKSVYYAYQNNWDFNASLTQNGQVIVPSMETLGTNLVASRITYWADKNLNIPAGSTYQMYQAVNSVVSASQAVAAARAAGDAAKLTQAQSSLAQAQAQLTVIAINIALNSCEACQQFFASVDRVLAAPPGFTNALVAGAIASSFGLGPAGLIAAAAIYLFGVYKVEYKCPIPPPDWFALKQFDNPEDAIDPFTSDYYKNPNQLIKDHPAEGENPFNWDDGVPFRSGNNPELWMAWSRYFTGKLLDATMSYGETQGGVGKPLQILTYRQANVEFFAPRSTGVFGAAEATSSKLGLGFTQNSTKTTDWVHASFGGLF